jgi:hypothetical protein
MIIDIFILSLAQVICVVRCSSGKLLDTTGFLRSALSSISLGLPSSKFALVCVSSAAPRLVILNIYLVLELFVEFGISHVVDMCDLLKTLHLQCLTVLVIGAMLLAILDIVDKLTVFVAILLVKRLKLIFLGGSHTLIQWGLHPLSFLQLLL